MVAEIVTLHNGNSLVETFDGIDILAGGSLTVSSSNRNGLLKDAYLLADLFKPLENIYVTSSLNSAVQLKNQQAVDMIAYGTRVVSIPTVGSTLPTNHITTQKTIASEESYIVTGRLLVDAPLVIDGRLGVF